MNKQILIELIKEAKKLYGANITPCVNRTWGESVTIEDNTYYLWFNSPNNSTNIVKRNFH